MCSLDGSPFHRSPYITNIRNQSHVDINATNERWNYRYADPKQTSESYNL